MTAPISFERALRRAQEENRLVRVERAQLEDGHMDAHVVGIGDGLVVLALIGDAIVPDGFVALRLDDLTSVRSPAPYSDFVESVLRVRGRHGAFAVPRQHLSWASILGSATRRWPLVAVHTETSEPDVVYIGQALRIPTDSASILLRLVGPDGKWRRKRKGIPTADISRIDFGGLYEEALAISVGLIAKGARRGR